MKTEDTVKIAMLNCAGLRSHIQDIKSDNFLLQADIIHLVETSLQSVTQTNDLLIDGYKAYFHSVSRGKGIASYVRNNMKIQFQENDAEDTGIQIVKFNSEEIESIVVYRSSFGNVGNLTEKLSSLPNTKRCQIITGDFNICMKKKPNNLVTSMLVSNNFKLITDEATHIGGGYIDQAYIRDEENLFHSTKLERYSPYYSDHDALCITLKRKSDKSKKLRISKSINRFMN